MRSALPKGWSLATLNDLAAPQARSITDGPFGSNLTSAHYTDHGPRVIRLQNIGDGRFIDNPAYISDEHFKTLLTHEAVAGDLVLASLGTDLPRACLVPDWLGPAIVKADCIRVRLGQHVDPRWALYAMQAPAARSWAAEQMHGVGRPRLGLKVIREIPVPLPPLAEQRRIVDILDDHLSRLDAAETLIHDSAERLDVLQQRVIERTLTGADWGATPGSGHLPAAGVDDGPLADLPHGWRWQRLNDLADVVGGVTKDSSKQSDPSYVEVPYLRVANVQRGHLDLSNITTIRVPPTKAANLTLLAGDVLLNEGGDRDKLGRGWVWNDEIPNCIHQNHVFRARVRDRVLDPYLLSWAANTLGGPWCERNGKQSVNLASISMSRIRLMPVPVPPTDIQAQLTRAIDEHLESNSRLRAALESTQQRSIVLRRALLKAAFASQLTGYASDLERVEEAVG